MTPMQPSALHHRHHSQYGQKAGAGWEINYSRPRKLTHAEKWPIAGL
jgi:hypothetical protein